MRFKRFFLFVGVLFSFAASALANFPMIDDKPIKADRSMNPAFFEFVSKTLGAGRMGPHMKCSLKTRASKKLQKFSSGEQWVELLELDFSSNGFDSGNKMNFRLPSTAKYGVRTINNQWSGVGEEVRIELGDYYGHWIEFTHDGEGRLVQLLLGNELRLAPCEIR